jgi:hypothetical protein
VNKGRVVAAWVIVAASLGVAACSTNTPSTPGTTSAPTTTAAAASPTEQFAAALGKLKTVGFDATLSVPAQGATIKASVDYATKAATQTATVDVLGQTLSVAATMIGSDLWMKADLGPLARGGAIDKTKWYRVDPAKLNDDSKPFDLTGAEPLAITSLFASVAGVTRTDATHLTGIAAPAASEVLPATSAFYQALNGA